LKRIGKYRQSKTDRAIHPGVLLTVPNVKAPEDWRSPRRSAMFEIRPKKRQFSAAQVPWRFWMSALIQS
jgi:hypothetical protein